MASMQDSWQVFVKPAMGASHVDAAFQASANAAASMAGRVLFPFHRWNDCGKADSAAQYHERSENNSVPMTSRSCGTMPVTGLNLVEGHAGHWKMSADNLVVAKPQSFSDGVMAGGLDSTAETSIATPGSSCSMQAADHIAVAKYNAMTPTRTTRQSYDWMPSGGGVLGTAEVAGHNAEMTRSFGASAMEAGESHGGPTNGQIGPYENDAEIHGAASEYRSNMFSQRDLNVQEMKQKSTIKNSKNEIQMKSFPHKTCKQSMVQQHPTVHAVPRCQIDGCKQDLSKAKKDYHRRHKVCEMHSKAACVLKAGLHQRFCQQCSRFHVVGDFDDAKRSCRRRLEGHNRRRRKPISQGYGKLIDLNQVVQQHRQLMAAAALMAAPLQQQLLFNEANNMTCNHEASHQYQHHLQYDQNLQCQSAMAMNNSTPLPPPNFEDINNRLLTLLNYSTPSSSSSSSSSSPSLFNHSDPTCALSLLSCHPPPDQSLTSNNSQENSINPNLSDNPITTNPSSNQNLMSHSANYSTQAPISSAELVKDIPYTYPLSDYWQNLGLIQSLGQHYTPNFIANLLRQSAALSTHNPHI